MSVVEPRGRTERLELLRRCSGMHSSLQSPGGTCSPGAARSPEPDAGTTTPGGVNPARRRLLSSPDQQQQQQQHPVRPPAAANTALPPTELVFGPRRRAHNSITKQLPAGSCALRVHGNRACIGDGSAANARVIEFFNAKGAHALFNRLVGYLENTRTTALRGRYKNRHLQPMAEFFAPEFRRARIGVFVCSQPGTLRRPAVKWLEFVDLDVSPRYVPAEAVID